ncbi:MAG: hypothetical protein GYA57_15035 [Myxococcales bacterium]|nr:hypothetical protein [Myxococcales bacterium]
MTEPAAPGPGVSGAPAVVESPQEAYANLPWYRRGSINSGILVLALVILVGGSFVPGLPFGVVGQVVSALSIVVSVCVLSGPVYDSPKPEDNVLREWGVGNKIVAVLFVLFGVAAALSAVFD